MLLSLAIALQQTGLMRALRESGHGYEILLSLHVSFIALFGAMIAITDARLLGLAPAGYSVSDIVDQLRVPKRVGFLCVATCGFLLFGMKAEEYYLNVFFRVKVLLFLLVAVHALIFRSSVYNCSGETEGPSGPPARAKAAAVASFLLWFGIVCAGRGIGYIHPPPFSHHFALARTPGPLNTVSSQTASSRDEANGLSSESAPRVFSEKGRRDAGL
jgi:hypothetical protein